MPLPPPKKGKKPAVGIELLLGDEEGPPSERGEGMGGTMDEEMGEGEMPMPEDSDFETETETDALASEDEFGDEAAPTVDPEVAALAEKLGFTDPEQQQALSDLIELVQSRTGASAAPKESGALPPLPESAY